MEEDFPKEIGQENSTTNEGSAIEIKRKDID